ncbi:MAG: BrnA antitoxin family protein [Pseudomonadota bacterium]|nr:BrnA antitoxin family protein [Pseudomonadota bacterium]
MAGRLKPIAPDGENPEWTQEDFALARRAVEIPALAQAMRGRPTLAEDDRKLRVTLYLDRDIVGALKKDGRGWQTRANARLREILGL